MNFLRAHRCQIIRECLYDWAISCWLWASNCVENFQWSEPEVQDESDNIR